MSQTLDLIPHSNLTASTFDNEVDSPCYDRCHPNQVAVPGSKVYWQSVADAKCQNQWMEADWSPLVLSQYQTLQLIRSPGTHIRRKAYNLQLTSSSKGSTTTASVLDLLNCRTDSCTFSNGANAVTNVIGAKFTWMLSLPAALQGDGVCQMNINMLQVVGTGVPNPIPIATAATAAASSPTSIISPNANNQGNPTIGGISLPEIIDKGNQWSTADIIWTFFVCLVGSVLAVFGGLYLVRLRNLAKRKRETDRAIAEHIELLRTRFAEGIKVFVIGICVLEQ
ncbi:hypothetical protein BCR33DRAFT_785466 [Rhizoclosmatium globosum]|uniref:Uncharacterized protein n=1 Tax=Rhizoclosmatium globosum TaxID=329046 RepID=A0A1Y2C9B1_9FUNG|nr:hypothetical protein BCR33DRAFT_785466 [Rhizoclosmatium globosum]|eukprot:ORY43618.1 hypothetical protein BCR33DRAFT_785466 [Rhizoclosmatium globosum]